MSAQPINQNKAEKARRAWEAAFASYAESGAAFDRESCSGPAYRKMNLAIARMSKAEKAYSLAVMK